MYRCVKEIGSRSDLSQSGWELSAYGHACAIFYVHFFLRPYMLPKYPTATPIPLGSFASTNVLEPSSPTSPGDHPTDQDFLLGRDGGSLHLGRLRLWKKSPTMVVHRFINTPPSSCLWRQQICRKKPWIFGGFRAFKEANGEGASVIFAELIKTKPIFMSFWARRENSLAG